MTTKKNYTVRKKTIIAFIRLSLLSYIKALAKNLQGKSLFIKQI